MEGQCGHHFQNHVVEGFGGQLAGEGLVWFEGFSSESTVGRAQGTNCQFVIAVATSSIRVQWAVPRLPGPPVAAPLVLAFVVSVLG